ncbi:MAG: FAD-binding protein, partial [Burkholderiales bacterium]|nr:FAD-binding protein [Burkholderiales bacterium]
MGNDTTNSVVQYSVKLRHPQLPTAFCAALSQQFGQRFVQTRAICEQHGRDESCYDPMPPQAVLFVHTTEEVADAVRLCRQYQVPVIAFGTGTSLEGHLLAIQGGLCLDLSAMQQILAMHTDDLTVRVQAGVTRKQLNHALRDSGFFFPIDPGADASLGGMAATRASGTNAVRYGTMRDNTLALTAVMADGSIVQCGSRAKKSSTGYDLTRLLVGSEGTLGIITELELKIYPQPESTAVAVCSFADTVSAVRCVMLAMQTGIALARVEFLDKHSARALNTYAKLNLPEQALLLFEFHGSAQGVAEQAQQVQEIALELGGGNFAWATAQEERNRLWAARHQAYFALLHMRPGGRAITTDCCVPISQLADLIATTEQDCERHQMIFSIIGHVGDGNFHLLMMVDPAQPQEMALAESINSAMVERALACGGTCSGEHGI